MLKIPSGDFQGVIFDCDGTLADSMPVHYRAWVEAFKLHHAKFDFPWELFYSMAGTGLEDAVVMLNGRFRDPLDAGQRRQCISKTGGFSMRQICLRRISGHRHMGALAQSRQKHFHLRWGRILRLIQNDR